MKLLAFEFQSGNAHLPWKIAALCAFVHAFGWLIEAGWNRHGLSQSIAFFTLAPLTVFAAAVIMSKTLNVKLAQSAKAKIRNSLGCFGLSCAFLISGYIVSDLWYDNLRFVIPNELYRSRQMGRRRLSQSLEQLGIRTLVNLRGRHDEQDWYRDEIEVSKSLGVRHLDFSFLSHRELGAKEIAELVRDLKAAPKPILIHCEAGADRSGLVAALYLYVVKGRGADESSRELTVWNGHIPWVRPGVAAMDLSFWLCVSDSSSPESFTSK